MGEQACQRCGVELVAEARFCHSCGLAAPEPAIDVDLFNADPEARFDASAKSSPGGPWIAVLLLVALVGGVWYLVSGESAEQDAEDSESGSLDEIAVEEAEAPPSTTTVVDESDVVLLGAAIADGYTDLGELWPIAVVDSEVGTLLFGSRHRTSDLWAGEGLEVWRLDGRVWIAVGPVMDLDVSITTIIESGRELYAAGLDAEGRPTVWRSFDGVEWTAEALPMAGLVALGRLLPYEIVVSGDRAMVLGHEVPESRSIDATVRVHLGIPDDVQFGVAWEEPTGTVSLHGPLGLVGSPIPLEELGLSSTDLFGDEPSGQAVGWTRVEGAWQSFTQSGFVWSVGVLPDGRFAKSNGSGIGIEVSRDGENWEPAPELRVAGDMATSDSLVAIVATGGREIRWSSDLVTWQSVELRELTAGLGSDVSELDVGDAGLLVRTYQFASEFNELSEEPRAVVLVKDGVVIEVDDSESELLFSRDGEQKVAVPLWGEPSDSYSIDFSSGMVSFTLGLTSDHVELTFEELRLLDPWAAAHSRFPDEAVAVSTNGVGWSVTELNSELSPDEQAVVTGLVGGSLVVVAAEIDQSHYSSGAAPSARVLIYELPS